MMRLLRTTLIFLGVATAASFTGTVASAQAVCAPHVSYLGMTYLGQARLPASDVGPAVGTGSVPDCQDLFINGQKPPPKPPTPVTVNKVVGVAPRFAVYQGSWMLVGPLTECGRSAQVLTCLRDATTRFERGPSLAGPVQIATGSVARFEVRVPRAVGPVAPLRTAVLQTRRATGWGRVEDVDVTRACATACTDGRGTYSVVLPAVDPGVYRLRAAVDANGNPVPLASGFVVAAAPNP